MDVLITLIVLMKEIEPSKGHTTSLGSHRWPVAEPVFLGSLAPGPTLQIVFKIGSWHNLGTFLSCSDEQMLELCCF